MNILRKAKILLNPFLWIIYFLSGFISRSEKIIVFGSLVGKRFADNPKYLFLYLNNYYKDKDKMYVWITRDKKISKSLSALGFKCYNLYSLKGLYYVIRAKYFVYDHEVHDIFYWLSKGAVKVNLWHGVPLKKIRYDMKNMKFRAHQISKYYKSNFSSLLYRVISPWVYNKPDILLSTSKFIKKIFISAFNVKDGNIIISNYPRNIALFEELHGESIGINIENFKKVLEAKDKKFKIIIYLPTFRDSSIEDINKVIDFRKLDSFCETNNIKFFIKPHPSSKLNLSFEYLNNICKIDKFEDIYPYLRYTDILITDYSSVFFDFYLTKKPIIFFPYDLTEYISKNREMYFEYDDVCIGFKAYNFYELLNAISDAIDNPLKYRKNIDNIITKFFEKANNPKDISEILRVFRLE